MAKITITKVTPVTDELLKDAFVELTEPQRCKNCGVSSEDYIISTDGFCSIDCRDEFNKKNPEPSQPKENKKETCKNCGVEIELNESADPPLWIHKDRGLVTCKKEKLIFWAEPMEKEKPLSEKILNKALDSITGEMYANTTREAKITLMDSIHQEENHWFKEDAVIKAIKNAIDLAFAAKEKIEGRFKQSRCDGAWICNSCGVAVYPTVESINEHLRECKTDRESWHNRVLEKAKNEVLLDNELERLLRICWEEFQRGE